MADSSNRPLMIVVIVVVVVGALWFGWSRYKAATGVSKEQTVKMTTDEIKKAMQH